jgi:hypothetical protein
VVGTAPRQRGSQCAHPSFADIRCDHHSTWADLGRQCDRFSAGCGTRVEHTLRASRANELGDQLR